MDGTVRYALERQLRRERARLREETMAADTELESLADSRESEFEEVAQHDRMAHMTEQLDLRAKHEIEEIDAALMRLAEGRYGFCLDCGRRISIARLRALPATRHCVRCARHAPAPAGVSVPGQLPPEPRE